MPPIVMSPFYYTPCFAPVNKIRRYNRLFRAAKMMKNARPGKSALPHTNSVGMVFPYEMSNRIWYHTTPPWVEPETPSFTKPNFA